MEYVHPSAVHIWHSTVDLTEHLQQQQPVAWMEAGERSETTIVIDDQHYFQQIEGFGASLTDSAAWLIMTQLPSEQREVLMHELFDINAGIGMNYLRQPMGATDITTGGLYSYDDMPSGMTDFTLEHFSVEHDDAYIIPAIQQARHINPNIQVMATPWSPPGWMKTSDSMIGGSLRSDCYDALARYFVRFLQAYEERGIDITAVTVQNEPTFTPAYPGMLMTPEEQATFVKRHLGPRFREANLHTKILLFDHNWSDVAFPLAVLNDPEVLPYVAGTAFHRYIGIAEAQSVVHRAFPEKDIYFTEGSTGVILNLPYVVDFLTDTLRHWAKTAILWNIAYDQQGGPFLQPGGCAICRPMLQIDTRTSTWTHQPDYYALGHFSKFVHPGAYRIASDGGEALGLRHVAFRNPDGTKVMVAHNQRLVTQACTVQTNGSQFHYPLPPGAVITCVWE